MRPVGERNDIFMPVYVLLRLRMRPECLEEVLCWMVRQCYGVGLLLHLRLRSRDYPTS
jgi:hypothetical protein